MTARKPGKPGNPAPKGHGDAQGPGASALKPGDDAPEKPLDPKPQTEMQEAADQAGDEAETPRTIRELCKALSNRISEVMAVTGKNPGQLTSMVSELDRMKATDHPLMDFTD